MEPNYQPNISNGYKSQHPSLLSLSSLSNMSQYPHTTPGTPNTLPPLHTQNGILSFPQSTFGQHAASAPQTPRTSHAPGAPSVTAGGIPHFSQLAQLPTRPLQLSQSAYLPGSFQTSQTMVAPSSLAQSASSSTAPAGLHNGRLPDIRPMPQGGFGRQMQMPVQAGFPQLMSNPQLMPGPESPPTHVVGSQGRRGVLPAAPGRPAVGDTTAPGKGVIPPKDEDGKFPCPHCTKTYLHAKHLKRHLLRHTGDRPYQCALCKDTFSRSDILKRHFQKCSLRRGNPQGIGHLTNTGAQFRKAQAEQLGNTAPASDRQDPGSSNSHQGVPHGLPLNSGFPSISGPTPEQVYHSSSLPSLSNRSSRSSSIIRPNSSTGQDGRTFSALGTLTSAGVSYPNTSAGVPPNNHQNTSSYSMNQMPPLGPMPQYSSFTPVSGASLPQIKTEPGNSTGYGRGSGLGQDATSQNGTGQGPGGGEWPQIFQPNSQDGFAGSSNMAQGQMPGKSEPGMPPAYQPASEGMFNGVYGGDGQSSSFQNWNDMVSFNPGQTQ